MPSLVAIVAASGIGSRMLGAVGGQQISLPGNAPTKLFVPLGKGKPVFIEALNSLLASECVDSIVLAVSRQYYDLFEANINEFLPNSSIKLVIGGSTRQESVELAFDSLIKDYSHVLIHDAARPYPKKEDILAVYEKAKETGAAILASKATSTVKLENDESGVIEKTLNREKIWLAQTPQIFEKELLKRAFEKSEKEQLAATDESFLVESLPHAVSLVRATSSNPKITYLSDLDYLRKD